MESAGRNSFNPNKQLKEEFVSNLTGSSILEIAALSTIFPVVILLRHSFGSYGSPEKGSTFESLEAGMCLEVCFCVYYVECPAYKVVPSKKTYKIWCFKELDVLYGNINDGLPIHLVSYSSLSNYWIYLWALLLMLILASFTVIKRSGSSLPSEGNLDTIRTDVSLYRVCLMVVTCLCILAVDFRVFPRRYAKTETYGASLMDLGVGSFVLANAFVSRQARNASSLNLWSALSTTSPLILLGFGRLVSAAGVDYQVHVGEYGVHWNFFFTLAAVAVLSSLINVPPQYCGILGSLVLVGYQVCLNNGLNTYLLSSDRGSSIISQNKEGVFSILGYWGMYLLGVNLGNYFFFKDQLSSNIQRKAWKRRRVWTFAVLFWLLAILLDKHVERVSRRMCNLSYVIMVVAVNLQWLAVLKLSDFVPGSSSSVLEDAFNRNLLASFLVEVFRAAAGIPSCPLSYIFVISNEDHHLSALFLSSCPDPPEPPTMASSSSSSSPPKPTKSPLSLS